MARFSLSGTFATMNVLTSIHGFFVPVIPSSPHYKFYVLSSLEVHTPSLNDEGGVWNVDFAAAEAFPAVPTVPYRYNRALSCSVTSTTTTSTLCQDPNVFLNWDGIHFTHKFNTEISKLTFETEQQKRAPFVEGQTNL
ncbi:hypothetical protein GOP47_0009821 [Adiantum capillus-veneris]|uniref:Uncharacterized protein n=1 Tax=Adiantum capillus-veneris TaxID=13818 RepID=A0A9D4ZK17_ADICA|nr:hypothetical protein GOP47_0009821 [Adiantum capillus-veneris]